MVVFSKKSTCNRPASNSDQNWGNFVYFIRMLSLLYAILSTLLLWLLNWDHNSLQSIRCSHPEKGSIIHRSHWSGSVVHQKFHCTKEPQLRCSCRGWNIPPSQQWLNIHHACLGQGKRNKKSTKCNTHTYTHTRTHTIHMSGFMYVHRHMKTRNPRRYGTPSRITLRATHSARLGLCRMVGNRFLVLLWKRLSRRGSSLMSMRQRSR